MIIFFGRRAFKCKQASGSCDQALTKHPKQAFSLM